ncbi:ATP-binding protein [Alteromonas pelagimontana]|nr:ATP-binding protein [Alteromonas pelagimontana]
MFQLNTLNPARRLMGRLFLWFWITFILTGLLALWLGSVFSEDVEIGTPSEKEIRALDVAVKRIGLGEKKNLPLPLILERGSRQSRYMLFAINLESKDILRGAGPPMRPQDRKDLLQVATQQVPISLKRRGLKILGPKPFVFQQVEYVLFMATPNRSTDHEKSLFWVIGLAIIMTVALSYLFAKSLVKPIHQLQETSRRLAKGDWQARVSATAYRRDELGELARDFNTMAEQLESMWNGQKRLLADISHELRSPLARLQMALGIAYQQEVDPATLTRIEREAERMEALINQLLQLTRAEAASPQMSSISLSGLLENVFADAHFEASNVNKHFYVNPLPSELVKVNETLICSAIENVVRNAIRYSYTEVKVVVTTTPTQWQLEIMDDGPGLSEKECEAIFTPFYRASLARERESGGVGLGLAIAKASVDLHHGTIQATPIKSGGLKITFRLPRDGR